MISNPSALFIFLFAITASVVGLSKNPRTRGFFKYLPAPLWCYFIPTLLSTLNVVPSDAALYSQLSRPLLPACLFLLLLSADVPSILKLSPRALGAMLAGTVGIFLGGIATFILFSVAVRGGDPQSDAWRAWGCLGATWTGGSANMVAVNLILQPPKDIFSNLIIVDTIAAYSWMALLVFASQYQDAINRWLGAEPLQISHLAERAEAEADPRLRRAGPLIALGVALAASVLFWRAAAWLPNWGKLFSRMSWTVILATLVPLALSLTPARRMAQWRAEFMGNFLLYVLLTTIGAQANLKALAQAPWFVGLGLIWVLIHGVILLAFGRLARIPIAILASASQANVGGTISTPLVATVYQKELATLGVLLAVLGNIYGTAAGLLLSEICRWLMDLV